MAKSVRAPSPDAASASLPRRAAVGSRRRCVSWRVYGVGAASVEWSRRACSGVQELLRDVGARRATRSLPYRVRATGSAAWWAPLQPAQNLSPDAASPAVRTMPPSYEPELSPVPLPRVARAMVAGLRLVRAHPVLNPAAFEESWRERGGYAVDPDHRPHLVAALDWLAGAQDASGEGGVARGYSLAWNPAFGSRAWQPADPGATGDIIPMLYGAARHLRRPGLVERAARGELELQLPSGAVRGGVVGERTAPGVFNTGRVLLAWLAAFAESGAG